MTGISALREQLEAGATSAHAEVTRIRDHRDALGCVEAFVPRAEELALASDERRCTGSTRGPLDGIPFAVKANIDVAGVPTTSGLVWADSPLPAADAPVVAALVAAGAIPVMIATMAPLAIGAVTRHPTIGTCRSPLDGDRHAGGSSGGSGAAVGSGLVPFALGSDTMGSVRIPAAYCGAVGWLPTHGALDSIGLAPLQPDLDNIGVVACTAADLVEVAGVLGVGGTVMSGGATRPRRFRSCDLTARADDDARLAVAEVTEVLRSIGYEQGPDLDTQIEPGALRRHGLILVEVHAARTFMDALDAGVIPEDIAALVRYGRTVGADRVTAAHDAISAFRDRITAMLEPGDVVVLPTTPAPAPRITDDPVNAADLTAWVNMAGLPAVALPVGDRSVQLIGTPGSDADLLATAAAVQAQPPNAGGLRSRNADTPS